MNNALYERAKKFANTNVIGNCGELECLAEMLYEFAEQETKDLEAQIEKVKNWCNCKNYQQCLIELAEQGKGMKPSECCVNCKKWEIKENE